MVEIFVRRPVGKRDFRRLLRRRMYLFVDVFDKVVQDEYPNDEKCPKRLLTTFYKVNKNIRFFFISACDFCRFIPNVSRATDF